HDDLPAEAVAQAREYAGLGFSVGVVCPAGSWDGVVDRIRRERANWRDAAKEGIGTGINMLTPADAKGLEFDHVVVVEPAAIAEEEQGLRGLYVALTRPTTRPSRRATNSCAPACLK
ncbi:MAG: ATP-binding domain-containing protein, partial [Gemmatimonadaceae bacterium]